MKKKIIIFGGTGLLGSDIAKELKDIHSVLVLDSSTDITNMDILYGVLRDHAPDIVINCAAISNVDACENEKISAIDLNYTAVKDLAAFSNELNYELFHFSTDYVFNGTKNERYSETDARSSVNFYGYTKILAEEAIEMMCNKYKIFRVAFLIGEQRPCLYHRILDPKQNKIDIICDQYGDPTFTFWISSIVKEVISCEIPPGIYNLTSSAGISRSDFARYLKKRFKLNIDLNEISRNDIFKVVARPEYTSLCNKKLFSLLKVEPLSWEDQLEIFSKKNEK